MDSPEIRKQKRKLEKVLKESNQEIEKERVFNMLNILEKNNKLTLQELSFIIKLNIKTLSGLIKRNACLFTVSIKAERRDDYNANDIKIKITNDGLSLIRNKHLILK